jgi:hypothetical protein
MIPVTRIHLALAILLPMVLTACGNEYGDPYKRQGTWSLPPDGLGANDTNLRAMVVNPSDLTTPHGAEGTSVAPLSTTPITKLYSGHRTPLLNGSASQVGNTGNGGQQGQQPNSGGGAGLGTGSNY